MKSSVIHLAAIVGVLIMIVLFKSEWPYKMYVFYPMAILFFGAWLLLMREIVKRSKKMWAEMHRQPTSDSTKEK